MTTTTASKPYHVRKATNRTPDGYYRTEYCIYNERLGDMHPNQMSVAFASEAEAQKWCDDQHAKLAERSASLRDYLSELNTALRELGRPVVSPVNLDLQHNGVYSAWEDGMSINDCIVRMAYWEATAKADRNA